MAHAPRHAQPILRLCLVSAVIALAGYSLTLYLYKTTALFGQVETALDNGWGVYQVSLALAGLLLAGLAALALVSTEAGRRLRRTLLWPRHIRALDDLALALGLFGLGMALFPIREIDWWAHLSLYRWAQAPIAAGLLYGAARLAWFERRRRQPPAAGEATAGSLLYTDAPITSADEDTLGSRKIAGLLVDLVSSKPALGSFVVAITGKWGSGKTSVFNLARQQLAEKAALEVIEFSPWILSSEKTESLNLILTRFFQVIERRLAAAFPEDNWKSLIRDYYQLFSPLMKNAPLSLDAFFKEEPPSFYEQKERINTRLKQTGKHFILFVDDIDRMDSLEISYLFKLIRLCGDFDNLIYVLAFDREVVIQRLAAVMGDKAEAYLDKFIQYELRMPYFDPVYLRSTLNELVKSVSEKSDVHFYQDREFTARWVLVERALIEILDTPRAMKLYCNRVLVGLMALDPDVNPFDFMLIELIRVEFPALYRAIYENEARFLFGKEDTSNDESRSFYNGLEATIEAGPPGQWRLLLFALFPKLVTVYPMDLLRQAQADSLKKATLGPSLISKQNYFPRYFIYGVQQGMLSEKAIAEFEKQLLDCESSAVAALLEKYYEIALHHENFETWFFRLIGLSQAIQDADKTMRILNYLFTHSAALSYDLSATSHEKTLLGEALSAYLDSLSDQSDFASRAAELLDSCADIEVLYQVLKPVPDRWPGLIALMQQKLSQRYLVAHPASLDLYSTLSLDMPVLEFFFTREDLHLYFLTQLSNHTESIPKFISAYLYQRNDNQRWLGQIYHPSELLSLIERLGGPDRLRIDRLEYTLLKDKLSEAVAQAEETKAQAEENPPEGDN